MKLFIATFITLLVIGLAIMKQHFLPFRTVSVSRDSGAVLSSSPYESSGVACDASTAGRLISPLELQQQINATLRSYFKPEIPEDGKIGPRTASAYCEAYSLQQAEIAQKGCYK